MLDDSRGFLGILDDSRGFLGILGDAEWFFGFLEDSRRFLRILLVVDGSPASILMERFHV